MKMEKSILGVVLLLSVGPATAADWSAHGFLGSLGTDRLGGIGSSKSTLGVGVDFETPSIDASARFWRLAEKLDDDAGISPETGGTIEAGRRLGPWRAGVAVVQADGQRFNYASIGIHARHARLDWWVPLGGDSRFGLRAELRAPLAGGWTARIHYEYFGRQDPDIKISHVGMGIGRTF